MIRYVLWRRTFRIVRGIRVSEGIYTNLSISLKLSSELLGSLGIKVFWRLLFFIVAAVLVAVVRHVYWSVFFDLLLNYM